VTVIELDGVVKARAAEVLAENDVYQGRPLVLIRTGTVEAALESDPWVKAATVRRRFPDRVEVRITERREVAAVAVATGWQTVSDDGRMMNLVTEPPIRLAQVGPRVALAAGGETISATMLGVVEFLAALPDDVLGQTTVTAEGSQLMAAVDAHRVRLGTPTHMAAKAAALVAVLNDSRLAADAIIDLIAPSRPAVSAPPPAAVPNP